MHDHDDYARILDETTEETRDALATLAALLGGPVSEAASTRTWAARRLGVAPTELTAIDHVASPTGIAILGYVLGLAMDEHDELVTMGGPGEGEPPTWAPLLLGSDRRVTVPARLIASFPAGALAEADLCVAIDNKSYRRELTVYSRRSDRPVAQSVMNSLLDRVRGGDNPFRGQILEATTDNDYELRLTVTSTPPAPRSGLVLPDALWNEVDLFAAAATVRRDTLRELGLGTSRGLLLAGPPGTGKTHLSRVLASELAGAFSVIIGDASALKDNIREIYDEADVLGPIVVVLEDIDLIIGHRDSGSSESLADFLSALDGIRQRDDILTIATTNDPKAIDPAAQRTARFDTILTLPKPGLKERASILATYLAPLGLDLDPTPVASALDGCTGSDVREVVRRAVLEHGRTFTADDLVEIARSGRWQPTPSTGQYL